MDIEKLIEKLRTESLYKDKATLEIMDLCMEAADKLERSNDFDKSQSAKLLAENGKLRAELEQMKQECPSSLKLGHWIAVDKKKGTGICSVCNRLDSIDSLASFCRYCGACMEQEEEA